jgi:hypothetical protein
MRMSNEKVTVTHSGSLLEVTDHVTCCNLDDLPRFQKIIKEATTAGEVPVANCNVRHSVNFQR